MVKRIASVVTVAGLLAALFWACEKPVKPSTNSLSFTGLSLSVAETTLASVTLQGKTFLNQPAARCTVTESNAAWDPATGEPVIYNIYKYYSGENNWNRVARIFAGGKNYAAGDTLLYLNDNGLLDTLLCKPLAETTVVLGTENQNPFYYGCAALTNLALIGGKVFSGGFESERIHQSTLRAGALRRVLSINNGDLLTARNLCNVSVTFNRFNITSIDYIRYSAIVPLAAPDVFAIDSLLKLAGPYDPQTVPLNSRYRVRLADSTVVTPDNVTVGKFGGRFRVAVDSASLAAFFGSVRRISAHYTNGDTMWVTCTRQDTLPSGAGEKWIYANNASWSAPLSASIGIQPFNIDVVLDLAQANVRINAIENKVCLLGDDIPVLVNTFGDTTFEGTVYVWIATRNLSAVFMSDGKFKEPMLLQNANEFQVGIKWPDAILETPPEALRFNANGKAAGTLRPDYDAGYRVSPLMHLFMNNAGGSANDEYVDNIGSIVRTNTPAIHSVVTKGSILGYSEKRLGDFKGQDSFLVSGTPGSRRPFVGWFEVEPLASVSHDSTYSPQHLVDKFGARFGVSDIRDLIPVDTMGQSMAGRKFFSIYSAYYYTPDIPISCPASFIPPGSSQYIKLYKNPMRNLPYFITANMAGSKEFIICVYGTGKYFKEPRVALSTFTSTRKYVWDKIPPHFMWDTTYAATSPTYAPMYFVNPQLGTRAVTDLSSTPEPYVFDVWLSTKNFREAKDCALRDIGFGKITSVRLCFNYSADHPRIDPITGLREYSRPTLKVDIDSKTMNTQAYTPYSVSKSWNYRGYSIGNVAFKGLDARLWQSGLWDMWFETEDDLGNRGVAPMVSGSSTYNLDNGNISVRQISIK
ncbi:MAG: hypothetical protein V1913_05260 [Fibrobacterota bacterium]